MHDLQVGSIVVVELMSRVQPGEHVDEDAIMDRATELVLGARDHPMQRLPVEILHGDEVLFSELPDLVGLDQVRVIEARGEARLVEEHRERFGIVRQVGANPLDHDELVEPEIGGAARDREIDVRHPTLAERSDQAIFPELRVGRRVAPQRV